MQNFIELLKDHALILAATGNLSAITRQAEPRPDAAFAALRRLARLIEMHLRAEAEFIGQDRDHGRQEFTDLAAAHGERFHCLVAEWGAYLQHWDEGAMGADWRGFADATDRIVAQIDAQVDAENQSLYPAALRYGLIRLLPEKARAA
ncbi:MAG: hemerythrin domain-containing protein [Sphingobium sp.]|nr:hemerythrin domain-containing protein [Sphingobium sp.]